MQLYVQLKEELEQLLGSGMTFYQVWKKNKPPACPYPNG